MEGTWLPSTSPGISTMEEKLVEIWSDRPDLTMIRGLEKIDYRLAAFSGFA